MRAPLSPSLTEPGPSLTVRAERAGRVLTITLDRPGQANALDMSTACQLRDAVRLIDDGVGCVLLRAEGVNFCVGGDIRAFAAAPEPGKFLGELASVVHDAVLGLASAAAPVVVAVNGWAAGAGMSLAACADITLAAESARFSSAYSGIGLTPDCGLTWTLPRVIGRARAADLMLTNRPIDAAEAASIGLVARVVADDSLLAQAQAMAVELASGPTEAFGRIRKLLDASDRSTLADQLDAEAASIAACADHPQGRAGVAAFTAGRKPVFHR
jgi:2-(1,2-epoxy-1,2-dihydrophenyl)acetyl-CoA isomerase